MHEVLRTADLAPDETDKLQTLIGEAQTGGGYLHVEVRRPVEKPTLTISLEDATVIYEELRGRLPEDEAEELGDLGSWTAPEDGLHALADVSCRE